MNGQAPATGTIESRSSLPAIEGAGQPDEEGAAALRQLTLQRLMGYSVEYSDANDLRTLVAQGVAWKEAAIALAEERLSRLSGHAPSLATRRDLLLRASALLRMAQMMMLSDNNERRALYRRASELFAEAVPAERLTIDVDGRPMVAWLLSPAEKAKGSVLLAGGIEGWAMDLLGLGEALVARGLNAMLLDGPGQGETRLEHGHFLDSTWPRTYMAAITALIERSGNASIGILGNSVGGGVAMILAGLDNRIAACCNNGGLLVPLDQRERKGFFPKVEAFCGNVPADEVERIWQGVEITPDRLSSLTCPLLIVQGGLDPLVSVDDSTAMLGWAGSSDKRMHVFPEGDHCIYNHPADKHALIGDWFATRLLPSA